MSAARVCRAPRARVGAGRGGAADKRTRAAPGPAPPSPQLEGIGGAQAPRRSNTPRLARAHIRPLLVLGVAGVPTLVRLIATFTSQEAEMLWRGHAAC